MASLRAAALASAALAGFAGNSLLCRAALRSDAIDPLTFTALRLASGALVLWLLVGWRRLARRRSAGGGDTGAAWTRLGGDALSATALLAYALLFALAYRAVTAATGALLLFGAVQLAMIGQAARRGEALGGTRGAGIALSAAGLLALLLPGWQAPPWPAAMAMIGAGLAWGAYSLRGRQAVDPLADTAGNFLRSLPVLAVVLAAAAWRAAPSLHASVRGVGLAVASGAVASGLAYACWYAVLPGLRRATAGSLQLSVPVLTAVGGVALLGEPLPARLLGAGLAVLAGLALVLRVPAGGPR